MKMFLNQLKVVKFILFVFILLPFYVFAQGVEKEGKTSSPPGQEFSFHMGPYLPNQVDGVDEIQQTWGMRYGLKSAGPSAVEFGVTNSHAHGVDYFTTTLSLRGEMPLEDMYATFLFGLTGHYYKPASNSAYLSSAGLHMGSGMMMHVAGEVWFRSDMIFNFNPGVALYIGFGFLYRFSGSGGGEKE